MKYLLGLATSLILTMNGANALLANDLMSGINPFLCSDASFVIIEDNDTWSIPNSTADVSATENGWRIDNKDKSSVGYLRETGEGKWLLDWLTSDGHEQWNCIDLFPATSSVIEIVKPKIDENISKTQKDFEHVKQKAADLLLALTEAETEKHSALALIEKDLQISEGKVKYLTDALARSEKDLTAANERFKKFLFDQSSLNFLEELSIMGPSDRNLAIRKSKLGSSNVLKGSLIDKCIAQLRDKARLTVYCKPILVNFLLDSSTR